MRSHTETRFHVYFGQEKTDRRNIRRQTAVENPTNHLKCPETINLPENTLEHGYTQRDHGWEQCGWTAQQILMKKFQVCGWEEKKRNQLEWDQVNVCVCVPPVGNWKQRI